MPVCAKARGAPYLGPLGGTALYWFAEIWVLRCRECSSFCDCRILSETSKGNDAALLLVGSAIGFRATCSAQPKHAL